MHNLIIKKIWNVIQFKCGVFVYFVGGSRKTYTRINNTPHLLYILWNSI